MSMNIDWKKFITVDENWASKQLTEHTSASENKLVLRTHSIKYSGNKYGTKEFIDSLKDSITAYVLDQRVIDATKKAGGDPLKDALSFFGEVNPSKDGKYGELILYLLTESILKVPMIAFKITSSPKDQVKGADGIFCGDYNGMPSILIGEAKTWGDLGGAITSAFDSLNRFHEEKGKDTLNYEYLVAKLSSRMNRIGLSEDELNHVINCLTIGSDENKLRTIVHPVLIIYDDKKINELEHVDDNDAEEKLKQLISANIEKNLKKIKDRFSSFQKVSEMHLDFFFIPVNDIDQFRNDIFTSIHNITWEEYEKQSKKV
jgi:hypothetical protein